MAISESNPETMIIHICQVSILSLNSRRPIPMKTSVFPRMAAVSFFSTIAPLSAQNLTSAPHHSEVSIKADAYDENFQSRFATGSPIPGSYELPALIKAQGAISDGKPVYAAQDSLTLNPRTASPRTVGSVIDLNVLCSPSPYRKVAMKTGGVPYEIDANSLQTGLALMSAVYREVGKAERGSDCNSIGLAVEQAIKLDPAKVLEIVEAEVGANSNCACEIVKVAISTREADVALVVSIVETAITAAPDSMRIVSQCAIAAMPESIAEVQALLTKLDPNGGETGASAKSSKSAKSAKVANVASATSKPWADFMDLPPWPILTPPLIIPPPVTEVNPGGN